MSDPLDYAGAHKWQGQSLRDISEDELHEIWYALIRCAPVSLRVPKPNSRDSLIIALWRLDKALDKHRPLCSDGERTGGPNPPAARVPQRRY